MKPYQFRRGLEKLSLCRERWVRAKMAIFSKAKEMFLSNAINNLSGSRRMLNNFAFQLQQLFNVIRRVGRVP
ncbi:hypothetical protein AYK87_06520 [Stutzerimonas stutzeri]|nr:hypothetical protein AYK87_06520 [Stutzerimonas stutzeri]